MNHVTPKTVQFLKAIPVL